MGRKKTSASREGCPHPQPSEIHWWGGHEFSRVSPEHPWAWRGTGPAKSSAMHFWVSAEWTGACSGHQNSRSSFYGNPKGRPQLVTEPGRAQSGWWIGHSAETLVIRTGQTTASCVCIYKFKKVQVFGEVLLSRRRNGGLAISSEMGKSSSISKERDAGKLAFTRYSHLSRHLVAVIQSDPKTALWRKHHRLQTAWCRDEHVRG